MAEVETQCLYYAEMKIIIDSVELKERKTWGRSEVERERKMREKEQKGNKEKQIGV